MSIHMASFQTRSHSLGVYEVSKYSKSGRHTPCGGRQRTLEAPQHSEGLLLQHVQLQGVGVSTGVPQIRGSSIAIRATEAPTLDAGGQPAHTLIPSYLTRPVSKALHNLLLSRLCPDTLCQFVPWCPLPPLLSMATDASILGWRYQSSWGHKACGGWSEERTELHINHRELMVVRERLHHNTGLANVSVCFDMDNVTAVQCI